MKINEEEIQKFEENYKERLFEKLSTLIQKQKTTNESINILSNKIGIELEMPNIAITMNNKIVELSNEFKRHNLSMFVEPIEEIDTISTNLVGQAILDSLVEISLEGSEAIKRYNDDLTTLISGQSDNTAIEKTSPMKRLFGKIRNFFTPKRKKMQEDLELRNEIENCLSHLDDYAQADDDIWNYNLKDNLVSSIADYFTNRRMYKKSYYRIVEQKCKTYDEKIRPGIPYT